MSMGLFARKYKLSKRDACNYLSHFKGLEFSIANYEAEHHFKTNMKSADNTFEFLVEYISAKVVEWIIRDEKSQS